MKKKFKDSEVLSGNFLKQLFFIMKLTLFFLITSALGLFATGSYSQNTRVTLDLKSITVKEALKAIENTSEFYFIYNNELIDVDRKIDITVKDQKISDILSKLFDGENVEITVIDRKIVLAPVFIGEQQPTKKVTGIVTDRSGASLPGVTVVVKGTTSGVITDNNGSYSLVNLPANATLQFSFVGMKMQEFAIEGKTTINVKLEDETIGIEEVVAIGYGTLKKKDLTGSVSSVKAELIENEKPSNVQDILRGTVAGLEVGFSNSAKGGGNLEIRGVNSLKTSSYPLIVLDGVIYPGAMEDINPSDIETIDVLKDASSSAVFGARAANGVILITTKKGKAGKAVINFNSSIGVATMAKMADVYGPYDFIKWRGDVMKASFMYNASLKDKLYTFDDPNNLPAGVTKTMWLNGKTGDETQIWLSRLGMNTSEIQNYKDGKYTNWGDLVFQNGLRQDHNVSLSGKKDDITYFWSLGYNNNNGIIVGDQFKTVRSRINLDGKISDWLSVGFNTQFANRDESSIPATWQAIENNDPWKTATNADGSLFIGDDLPVGVRHPLYDQSFTTRRKIYNTLISNLYANLKLPFGITYQLNYAPRFEWYDYMNHQSALHVEWAKFGGQANREQSSVFSWQIDNLIKWNKTIKLIHKFDVTLLANAEKYQSWDNTMSAQGFSPTDALGFHNMSAGKSSSYVLTSNDTYSTGDALMARVFYSLRDKYMLTLSVRRDGYSAFGMGNPRGIFPSAALGWVFSDESLFKNNFLTYGKLRLSWGENGNREVGRYSALSDMGTGKYPYQSLAGSVYEINKLYVNHMANYNLKWERTRSTNVGFDFGIKNNILSGSVEVYKMNTLDLLIDRALPNVIGFASVTSNMGEVQNSGFEVTLNANIMKRKNFIWRSNFNFSLNRNKIVHLYGDIVNVLDASGNIIGTKESDDITNKWFIGHAIDQIWEPRIIGVWQIGQEAEAARYGNLPGDFRVEDVNKDGKITILDNEFQGYLQPRFRWNMRQDFKIYNNFDVSFTMYSYWGNYGMFNQAANSRITGVGTYPDRNNSYILPYWTPENPINDYARNFSGNGGALFDVWREKSFIRLDNLTLTYTLPNSILSRVKVSNLKVIGTVRNLGVWAPKWKFWDPEFSGPNPRYFTFGINLTI